MTTFIKSKAAKAVVGLLAMFVLGVAANAQAITFTQNLTVGSQSAEVLALQQFLNAKGFTVSTTGAGAPGAESTYFGTKTKTALAAFQAANGISPAAGYFGSITRGVINAMGTTTTPTPGLPAGCTSTVGYSPTTGLPCSTGTAPAQTGPVTVSLATTNPASGVIVAGQATARFLDVTFTGSGTVNSISLQRTGISDGNTLSNVYLYDGVTRLTDGYSFNNNGVLTMNNLGLVVSGSRTISVVADVATPGISGQTIAIGLTSFTAGTSATTASVQGNVMSVASGSTLASVTLTGSQSVGNATVNAGTSSYAVYRQGIQVNTRTVWLKAANFRITGSAPTGAVTNARLYVDGVQVGTPAVMTMTNGSNYLSFNLSATPFALTTGSHTFEIRADISAGSSYNFTIQLQQASDLMILDPQVGVNIAVSSFTAYAGGTITIGAGSATFVVDPSFSAMTNVTGGASNAVIAKFKIRGYGEDVKVTSLPVTPVLTNACTAGTTYGSAPCNVTSGAGATQFSAGNGLQNVTLYFNGSQVGSQVNWNSGAITFNLGSQLIIPAGVDSILEVRADLRSTGGVVVNSVSGQNYTAGTVSANLGAGTGEGWSSHTSVTTPTVNGTSLTIQTGLLAVAKNTGYANQSVSPNTAGVKVGSFVLQNQSSSEAVRVTGLTVGLTTDGTTVMTTGTTPALTNFSGLRTSETSGSGATPVQPQGSNVFSVDFTLAPGATKVIDIFADTSSATTGNIVTTLAVSALGSSSNTTISVAAVQGQTISLSAGTVATPTILSASSTSSQYIAAGDPMMTGVGAVDGTKATYNFVSTGGSATISELKFTVTGTNTVTSVRVGSVTAPVVGGVAWLQGLNLAVPNGGAGLTVDAFVSYAPVGTNGIAPATTSTTTLTYVKYNSGGTTTVLTPSVAAAQMTVVGSKPTLSVNGTQATGLIVGAENKVGEVTISADAKGNIKINDLKFNVGFSGFPATGNAGTLVLTGARIADGTTSVTGSGCVANGSGTTATTTIFCEFGTVGNTFSTGAANTESNADFDGYTLAAGTSKTLSVYATVTGTASSTGTVSVSTQVDSTGFNWDDTSAAQFVADGTTASPSAGTNLGGALIYNFPANSYSIRQ